MKRQYINRKGETVFLDAEVAPEGHGVRVPSFLIDGVPQTTHATLFDASAHRPGFRYVDDSTARTSHANMIARQRQAWRTTITDDDGAPADSSSAREAYIERMSNAWRTGHAIRTTRPPPAVGEGHIAAGALPGPYVTRPSSPKPPDVQLDAAPNSNTAWHAMVRRTTEAWRS